MFLNFALAGSGGRTAGKNRVLYVGVVAALTATTANALPVGYPSPYQPMTFSIDVQGPTAGMLDGFYGAPIYGTDILTPNPGPPGPNAPAYPPLLQSPPGIFIANPPRVPASPPAPGLAISPSPLLTGVKPFWGELDALSYGRDPRDVPFPDRLPPGERLHYVFSVDEFAIGLPGTAVRGEGALGNQQAAADTFVIEKPTPLPAGPLPPAGRATNFAFTDGDGIAPNGQPGLGLVEPNPPILSFGFDDGDNLDALDFDTRLEDRSGPVYFSLDMAFTSLTVGNDILENGPGPAFPILPLPNYGTAAANGFAGGDVLVGSPAAAPGGMIGIYAAANSLGLDLVGGPDTDDLDALKLWENGIDGYQQSLIPFDWLNGSSDMLLFSVRRGSALIGMIDSIFGVPIEEGDVLTTPCAAGSVLPDGTVCVGGGLPGIFTAAEWLGLATVRGGTAASWDLINPAYGEDVWADDLDGLDEKVPEPCNLVLLLAAFCMLATMRPRRREGMR